MYGNAAEMDANSLAKLVDSEDATNTLSPLPPVLRQGLAAVATFGFLSFLSSLWLFCFLTYKFVLWHLRPTPEKRATSPEPSSPTSLDVDGFLVPASHLCPQKDDGRDAPREQDFWQRVRREPPNQFLMLIYNLLLADIQQALAFLLNITWLAKDSLDVSDPACWVQGWFVSCGDLASSVFISAIAVHTYLGVVKGYRPPTWIFYAVIASLWAFVYGTGILAVIITRNGAGVGGLFVRAGAWVSDGQPEIALPGASLDPLLTHALVLDQLGLSGLAPDASLPLDLHLPRLHDDCLHRHLHPPPHPQQAWPSVLPLLGISPRRSGRALPELGSQQPNTGAFDRSRLTPVLGDGPVVSEASAGTPCVGTPSHVPPLPHHLRAVHGTARRRAHRVHGWQQRAAVLLLLRRFHDCLRGLAGRRAVLVNAKSDCLLGRGAPVTGHRHRHVRLHEGTGRPPAGQRRGRHGGGSDGEAEEKAGPIRVEQADDERGGAAQKLGREREELAERK